MTSALIRWHEAFQIFEPEIMLEDLDWEDTWQIPSSVRWRRMADNASFGWLLTWPALDVAISRFPFRNIKNLWLNERVISPTAPHVILALVFLELNEQFPVDAGS